MFLISFLVELPASFINMRSYFRLDVLRLACFYYIYILCQRPGPLIYCCCRRFKNRKNKLRKNFCRDIFTPQKPISLGKYKVDSLYLDYLSISNLSLGPLLDTLGYFLSLSRTKFLVPWEFKIERFHCMSQFFNLSYFVELA